MFRRIIFLKVQFRNIVNGTSMNNYWNNGRAVAFARSGRGFFAMAKEGILDELLQTGLFITNKFNFKRDQNVNSMCI